MTQSSQTTHTLPFAIGGLGGSGTRATAMIVRNCGCWLGGDLNDALDNLWFTLLFKRISVLTDSEHRLGKLFDLFQRRMQGELPKPEEVVQLAMLAKLPRFGHTSEWLQARHQSFRTTGIQPPDNARWGWKEPNTHIIIERLLRNSPELKYVHVVRDPIYMASSNNMNQLTNWGEAFLDWNPSGSAHDAIAFWVKVHQRIEELNERYPSRVMFFYYDRFMEDPVPETQRLLDFLQLEPPANRNQLFDDIIFRASPPSDPVDLNVQASPIDLAYCKAFSARLV
ncbi:MAG: sulfotransferase family protein [Hyphobacterium sp.]|nr:MAG: sulfotransferase family protein [Hyphobacterium sp.]